MGCNDSSLYLFQWRLISTNIEFMASISDLIAHENEYNSFVYEWLRRRLGVTTLYLHPKHDEQQKYKLPKSKIQGNKAASGEMLIKLDKHHKVSVIFPVKEACTPHSTLIFHFWFANIVWISGLRHHAMIMAIPSIHCQDNSSKHTIWLFH